MQTSAKFSKRLEDALRYSGLSKTDLATKSGVAPSTVSRWFAGAVPHFSTIKRIASTLNVNAKWLEIGDGEASDSSSHQITIGHEQAQDSGGKKQYEAVMEALKTNIDQMPHANDTSREYYVSACQALVVQYAEFCRTHYAAHREDLLNHARTSSDSQSA